MFEGMIAFDTFLQGFKWPTRSMESGEQHQARTLDHRNQLKTGRGYRYDGADELSRIGDGGGRLIILK